MKTIAKISFVALLLCVIVTFIVKINPGLFKVLPPAGQEIMFTVSNVFWRPDLTRMFQPGYKIPLTLEHMQAAIRAGGDVNAVESGYSVLMHALWSTEIKDHRIIIALIDAGADINYHGDTGMLGWALIRPSQDSSRMDLGIHPDVIKRLLDAGASVHGVDGNGWTVLIEAIAYTNHIEIIKMLIDARANVNGTVQPNTNFVGGVNSTVLMWAAGYYDDPAIIPMLIKAGARPTGTDKEGRTILDYANQNEFASEAMRLALTKAQAH